MSGWHGCVDSAVAHLDPDPYVAHSRHGVARVGGEVEQDLQQPVQRRGRSDVGAPDNMGDALGRIVDDDAI